MTSKNDLNIKSASKPTNLHKTIQFFLFDIENGVKQGPCNIL